MHRLSRACPFLPFLPLSAFLAAACAAACGGVPGLSIVSGEPPARVEAIAVEPVDVRLVEARSWNVWEKQRDVLAAIEAEPSIDAIAPWEFHVIERPSSPGGYLFKSDLGPRAEELGMNPDWVAVLVASIEERALDQLATMEAKGSSARARAHASRLVCRAELLHPGTDRVLARIERQADEDRFEDVPDNDRRPLATALLRSTVSDLLRALVDEGVVQPAAPTPRALARLKVTESPVPVLGYRFKDLPTLREHVSGMDAVLRTATLYGRFRYFEPDMDLPRFQLLSSLPAGLLVEGGAWRDVLPGDVVVCVNGRPARHTFQWRRAWRRGPPDEITRVRAGEALTVFRRIPGDSPPAAGCGLEE